MTAPVKTTHWAAELVQRGIVWRGGADGPNAYDCWSFVRYVQREHFGRELPGVHVDAGNPHQVRRAFAGQAEERAKWWYVKAPAEGDCVLMSHARFHSHIGVWIAADGGGILHCLEGCGVVFNTPAQLRAAGWGRVEYFRRGPE